jgi:hypothetical protein
MSSKSTYITVALLALLATSVGFSFVMLSSVTPTAHQAQETAAGGGATTVLTIKVYDSQGHLKTTETVNGDIFTYNFFAGTFDSFQNSASTDVTLYENGTNSSIVFPHGNAGYQYYSGNIGDSMGGEIAYIGIGSSSTSPTIWDYQLGNQLYSAPLSSAAISISGTQINISVSRSFTIANAASISEADLVSAGRAAGGTSWTYYVVNHDTFTPISVNIGDLVQVEYVYVLN